jgi:formylmethanofuran dehydrogenase subunit E
MFGESEVEEEIARIVKEAADFHGHLGPFLVIGVRMSLIALRELRLGKDANGLRVTATLKNCTPFSCVLDGIQVATGCTMGNRKLRLAEDSSLIAARFALQEGSKEVSVLVNPTTFQELKDRLLAEGLPPEDIRKHAHSIESMPEEKLFIVRCT